MLLFSGRTIHIYILYLLTKCLPVSLYSCHVHFEIPEIVVQLTLHHPCGMSHLLTKSYHCCFLSTMRYIFADKGKAHLRSISNSVRWGEVLPHRDHTAQRWTPPAAIACPTVNSLPVSHCMQTPGAEWLPVKGLCRPSVWPVVFCGHHSHSCKCALTSFPAPDTSKYGHNTLYIWFVFVNPDTWNSTL